MGLNTSRVREAGPPANMSLGYAGAPTPTYVWTPASPTVVGKPFPWFNPEEGTLLLEVNATNASDSFARIVSFNKDGASNNNTIEIQRNGTDARGFMHSGGVQQVGMLVSGFTQSTTHLIAYGYAKNDCAMCIDGGAVGTDTVSTLPSGINRLEFKSLNGTPTFTGNVLRFIYFDRKLANKLLPIITTRGSY